MTDITTPPVDSQKPYELTPEQEVKRIKRLIRKGVLPRFKIERKRVETGRGRHHIEFRLVSTLWLLTSKAEAVTS